MNENVRINSVRGVSQFILNEKLVTVIREIHEDDFICDNVNNISLFDYCTNRSVGNNNCKFLLEYHPSIKELDRIGSTIIKDIFLTKSNVVRDKSFGIDIRSDFITIQGQNKLYHGKCTPEDLFALGDKYCEEKLFEISGNPTCDGLKNYISKMNRRFETANELTDLKWAWCMVMDYNILKEITSVNDTTEYIVIVGDKHRQNIRDALSTWDNCDHIKESSNNNESNCVLMKI